MNDHTDTEPETTAPLAVSIAAETFVLTHSAEVFIPAEIRRVVHEDPRGRCELMNLTDKKSAPPRSKGNASNISHDSNESARFQAEIELVESELRAESLLSEMFEDMEVSL